MSNMVPSNISSFPGPMTKLSFRSPIEEFVVGHKESSRPSRMNASCRLSRMISPEGVQELFPFFSPFPFPFPFPSLLEEDGDAVKDGSVDGSIDGSVDGSIDGSIDGMAENSLMIVMLYLTVTSHTLSSNVSHGTGSVEPPTNAWHSATI